ncbi:chorismate-binding protein [Demequina sp. B12]|uniref:chorismate-binding protein n=1 Tax=Demequina sp. B12 TaxID=2992757 RepID=UPI00237AE775|nr:chorismate-binding protein [Demequina sp. B12]MDE0573008.1 chorismate-binding protein [Demequina sp. B12]
MEWTEGTWRGEAQFRTVRAWNPVEHIDAAVDGHRLAERGFWVVVGRFEGRIDAWRMENVDYAAALAGANDGDWTGPARDLWQSSMNRAEYMTGVDNVRAHIREGDVYQVNLCRVLQAPLDLLDPFAAASALRARLERGNPATYGSAIVMDAAPDASSDAAWVVSASPELYLRVDGARVTSSPIKGTAAPGQDMLPKDESENVMITDLVRNDLSHVALPGSVTVPEFLGLHDLPGLRHLQSTVAATLDERHVWTARMWPALLEGTFPPGSVSGAPKSSALDIIGAQERQERGPYCGAIGWVDADNQQAELAVGIRTFWWEQGHLRFGTGAGITWGSDPQGEWDETELKAQRLIALASAGTMAL